MSTGRPALSCCMSFCASRLSRCSVAGGMASRWSADGSIHSGHRDARRTEGSIALICPSSLLPMCVECVLCVVKSFGIPVKSLLSSVYNVARETSVKPLQNPATRPSGRYSRLHLCDHVSSKG